MRSDDKVDANHRAYFASRMANEWLSLRLDTLGACIVFLTAILSIVNRNSIPSALAALTLSEVRTGAAGGRGGVKGEGAAAGASLLGGGVAWGPCRRRGGAGGCPQVTPTHPPTCPAATQALDVTLFLKSAVTSGAMFESRFNSGAQGGARMRAHRSHPPGAGGGLRERWRAGVEGGARRARAAAAQRLPSHSR